MQSPWVYLGRGEKVRQVPSAQVQEVVWTRDHLPCPGGPGHTEGRPRPGPHSISGRALPSALPHQGRRGLMHLSPHGAHVSQLPGEVGHLSPSLCGRDPRIGAVPSVSWLHPCPRPHLSAAPAWQILAWLGPTSF